MAAEQCGQVVGARVPFSSALAGYWAIKSRETLRADYGPKLSFIRVDPGTDSRFVSQGHHGVMARRFHSQAGWSVVLDSTVEICVRGLNT